MRRAQSDYWTTPIKNLSTNPRWNVTGPDQVVRTNLALNPSFEATNGTATQRINLLTNPSLETTGSTNLTFRTNLAINPAMFTGTGLTTAKTNLCINPRGVNAFQQYSTGSQTITPNVAITGHPEGITTANRVTYTGVTPSNPGVTLFTGLTVGTTYSISAWVYFESTQTTPGSSAFAETGVIAAPNITPTIGVWQKITWTRTATSTNNLGFRTASSDGGTASYLITGVVVETAATPSPTFFDGATAASGDFTYDWTGTANASTSRQRINALGGYNSNGRAGIGKSTEWVADGTTSARITPNTSSKDTYFEVTGVTLETGKTYIISATCRLEAAQTNSPESRARRIVAYHSAAALGGTLAQSTQAPNAAGSTRVSVAVSVTDGANPQSIRLYNGAGANEGDVWWDSLLIEETDIMKPYFDGSTTPAQDVNHAWSGTAHLSTSLMRASLPSGMSNSGGRFGYLSTEWSARGTKSVKVVHALAATSTSGDQFIELQNMVGSSLLANTTYTISGTCRTSQVLGGTLDARALKFYLSIGGSIVPITYTKTKPNTAGASRVVGTFTTGASTTLNFLRVYNGASYGNGDVWWDELCLEEGITDGVYFDGSGSSTQNLIANSGFETNTTGWSGAGLNPGVLTRVSSQSHSGSASLQVAVDGTYALQGAFVSAGRPAIKPHMTYTATAWVKGDAGKMIAIECGELDSGTTLIGRTQSTPVSATGNWQRLSVTRSMGANAAYGDLVIRNYNAVAHTFYVDSVLYVQSDTPPNDYYSGTGDHTFAWTGTADASTSTQLITRVASWSHAGVSPTFNLYQSSIAPAIYGSRCAAVQTKGLSGDGMYSQLGLGVVTGQPYTFSAWVRLMGTVSDLSLTMRWRDSGAGILKDDTVNVVSSLTIGNWTRVSMTMFPPANAVDVAPQIRCYASHSPVLFYVDGVMVEQGTLLDSYFDGSFAASGDYTYAWAGTVNASSSRQIGQGAGLFNTTGGAIRAAFMSTDRPPSHPKFVRTNIYTSSVAIGLNPTDCVIQGNIARTDLMWIRSSRAVASLKLRYRTPSGAGVADWGTVNLPANQWTLVRAFGKPNVGDNAALGPIIEASNGYQAGDYLDLGPHMTVEGYYDGDYIDGTKPFSKWTGAVDQSVSVGYPPQLLDLAGKPSVDITALGYTTLPGDWSRTEGRTIYTVYNNLQDINDGQVYPILTYGATALNDVIPNQYITLRLQSASGPIDNAICARRTGGAGANSIGSKMGVNVVAYGLNSTGTIFSAVNNGPVTLDASFVMDLPHERINVLPATAYGSHVRTIIYRGYHDAATRAEVSRYLGNKYGAVVA